MPPLAPSGSEVLSVPGGAGEPPAAPPGPGLHPSPTRFPAWRELLPLLPDASPGALARAANHTHSPSLASVHCPRGNHVTQPAGSGFFPRILTTSDSGDENRSLKVESLVDSLLSGGCRQAGGAFVQVLCPDSWTEASQGPASRPGLGSWGWPPAGLAAGTLSSIWGSPRALGSHGCRCPWCCLACPHADFQCTPSPDGSTASFSHKVLPSLSSLTFQTLTFREAHLPNRLPRWHSRKESACQCRQHKRCGFDPWVRKIPWSRKWQPLQHFCWKIPWTEEPGGLLSMGSQRVGHD